MRQYYIKENKFPYKFIPVFGHDARKEILNWLRDECGRYNKDYIYWGLKGNPFDIIGFELYFKSKENAMAFKLRWL